MTTVKSDYYTYLNYYESGDMVERWKGQLKGKDDNGVATSFIVI